MNRYKVIASLHHQLAEAYDALAMELEERPKPAAQRRARIAPDAASAAAVARVRRGLREQGFKS